MKNFLLNVIALGLFLIIAPIGFIYQLIFKLPEISKYFFKTAVCIDQSGNVVCSSLFNLLLITSKGYKFGNPDETISSAIGKNYESSTLTWTGHTLYIILNTLEPNHSENAIEKDEEEA